MSCVYFIFISVSHKYRELLTLLFFKFLFNFYDPNKNKEIRNMNLELLESFGQNYTEDFDGTLDCMSVAVSCQFNRFLFV